jgi:hypothetical protein
LKEVVPTFQRIESTESGMKTIPGDNVTGKTS